MSDHVFEREFREALQWRSTPLVQEGVRRLEARLREAEEELRITKRNYRSLARNVRKGDRR